VSPRPEPSRTQRAKAYARSFTAKGMHDYLARIVTATLLFLTSIGGAWFWYYYGQYYDFQAWLHPPKSRVETGSVPTAAEEELRKKLEAECNSQKSKEVAALTQQRVAAFNAYENCLVEYKQTWSSDPTPKQYCAPKLAQHVQIAQEVRDRQAKNCTAAVPPMKK
jgi:uncharacterized iron-regulated membrane protein